MNKVSDKSTKGLTNSVDSSPGVISSNDTFNLKIHSPFKVYYDGPAQSVSGENATGPFDILAHHHNFMTLLSACELYVRASGGDHRIRITRGIMHVKADEVIVFLDV